MGLGGKGSISGIGAGCGFRSTLLQSLNLPADCHLKGMRHQLVRLSAQPVDRCSCRNPKVLCSQYASKNMYTRSVVESFTNAVLTCVCVELLKALDECDGSWLPEWGRGGRKWTM